MQIRQLIVKHFRGIESLDWTPSPFSSFCCVIGPGDSRKSTILDAIEAVLSTRWIRFTESDFWGCDTSESITIELTVGELSPALKSDDRFGLSICGWTAEGKLRGEPEGDDEPVLTVQLVVDSTLEPVWSLACERHTDLRILSNRDRLQFGCIRLAGDDARHLSWGQGSILSQMTGSKEEAASKLADAYKTARDSAKLDEIESLTTAAKTAEGYSRGMGAYIAEGYTPGLELGRSGISSNAISLHDGSTPLRLAGLGTRRLATLAMQRSAISGGAIVLIDEVELGLEPHRIIGAIAQLKLAQATSSSAGDAIGQILLTTHSDVALGECSAEGLYVCQLSAPEHLVTLIKPSSPDPINALLRHTPRALFARRILVTEGMTEVGLLLGLREYWTARHGDVPIEQRGAAIADGNGKEAVALCIALSELGFPVALFRDSDVELEQAEDSALASAKITIIEYGEPLSTEQAIFLAASDAQVQVLIEHARREHGEESVNGAIIAKITDLDRTSVKDEFNEWFISIAIDDEETRYILSEIAIRKKWFKDSRISRELATVINTITQESINSHLTNTLNTVENWLYA